MMYEIFLTSLPPPIARKGHVCLLSRNIPYAQPFNQSANGLHITKCRGGGGKDFHLGANLNSYLR